MINNPHKPDRWKFVADRRTVSKPGAKITVKELILTERGLEAITSGATQIKEGAVKVHGPNRPQNRKLEHA